MSFISNPSFAQHTSLWTIHLQTGLRQTLVNNTPPLSENKIQLNRYCNKSIDAYIQYTFLPHQITNPQPLTQNLQLGFKTYISHWFSKKLTPRYSSKSFYPIQFTLDFNAGIETPHTTLNTLFPIIALGSSLIYKHNNYTFTLTSNLSAVNNFNLIHSTSTTTPNHVILYASICFGFQFNIDNIFQKKISFKKRKIIKGNTDLRFKK